jgi:transcription antitermination factor NusG
MIRVGENPPARFPARAIGEAVGPWWVAKVKPRMEKALAFDFVKNNVEYYLPMYVKVARRKDNNKPRKSVIPLFPGYICFAMETPRNIFITGRVVNIVEIRNQQRFIGELTQIYTALEAGIPLEPCEYSFEPGNAVVVHRGPLRGVRGVISRISDQYKLILSVDCLGSAVVTIDAAMVKPA